MKNKDKNSAEKFKSVASHRRVLVAGAAGFIGSALAARLADEGYEVLGIDNLCEYYSPACKYERLQRDGFYISPKHPGLKPGAELRSRRYPNLRFRYGDICDASSLYPLLREFAPDAVVNLAAQPGVRFSRCEPRSSVMTNIVGFFNLLDASREANVSHFLYASSSSVYGNNPSTPFREEDECREPLSVYAATKLSDEIMAGAYSNAYGMRTTGVRMFSVYGPWGRPDMAPLIFASAISRGEEVELYGGGLQTRDFTYIDDVVESLTRLLAIPGGRGESEIYNIGSGHPVPVIEFLELLERCMGRSAVRVTAPVQPGEARRTFADSGKLRGATGYHPSTPLEEGVNRLALWVISTANS